MKKEKQIKHLEAETQVVQLKEDDTYYMKMLEKIKFERYNRDQTNHKAGELDSKTDALKARLKELENLIQYMTKRYGTMRIDPKIEYKVSETVEDKVRLYKTVEKITPAEFEGKSLQ